MSRSEIRTVAYRRAGVTRIASLIDRRFDWANTVCDNANEADTVFPRGTPRVHWSFDDPSTATGSVEQRLAVFRTVGDEIRAKIEEFLVADTFKSRLRRAAPQLGIQ